MNLFTGIMTYVIIWMLVLFTVLPIGVRTPADLGRKADAGHAASAPVNPRIGFKFLLTTLIATALFGAYYYVQKFDLLGFGSVVKQ